MSLTEMPRDGTTRRLAGMALAVAGLAGASISCGPTVVVAHLATPAVAAPAPTVTPTATRKRTTPEMPPPTATPTDVPTPRPTPASAQVARPAIPPTAAATPPAAPSFLGEWDFRADAGTGTIAGILRFRPDPAGLSGVYVGMR